MYEAGDDCFGSLNASGKHAIAEFAAAFYDGVEFDLGAVMSKVELQSSRLLNACVSHSVEFFRESGSNQIVEHFALKPQQFDWFVR